MEYFEITNTIPILKGHFKLCIILPSKKAQGKDCLRNETHFAKKKST